MAEQQRPKAKAIEVPTFHGIPGKDQLPPVAWVTFMENVQKSSGWNGAQTAEYAYFALRDKAAIWVSNLQKAGNTAVDDWTTFKPLFEARFHRNASIVERMKLRETLFQGKLDKSEGVLDFADRVDAAQFIFDESSKFLASQLRFPNLLFIWCAPAHKNQLGPRF